MSDTFNFDEVDRAIIRLLRKNGRATNQELAEKLGLTAATVSSRIRRMEDANKLRVVAVSDFAAHGLDILLQVMIEVDGRPAEDVAKELADIPEVFAVHLVTGPNDIDVLLALRNHEQIAELMLGRFAQIEGIRSMTPALTVDVLKYAYNVAPIDSLERVA